MKKKILFLLLALMLCVVCVLCFAACDEETPNNGNEGGEQGTPSTDGGEEEPAPHVHAYGNWTVTLAPTCGAKGERMRLCSCGDVNKESIFATNEHSYRVDNVCGVCGNKWEYTQDLIYEPILGGSAYAVTGANGALEEQLIFPYYHEGLPVTAVGEGAFMNLTGFEEVVLPDFITVICPNAFKNCSSLSFLTYETNSKLNLIGSGAFANTALTAFEVTADVMSIGDGVFADCDALTTFTVAEGNIRFSVGKGAYLVDVPSKTLLFAGVDGAVPADGSVTAIAAYAFSVCAAQEVIIPSAVTQISPNAFAGCESLSAVTFRAQEGWFVTATKGATTGTAMNVSDAAVAATALASSNVDMYWYRAVASAQ